MGFDDISVILSELVQFLESLSQEVSLPSKLENDRTNLLRRSRSSLAAMVQRSASPEPYLDMNAGKGKGLHLVKSTISTISTANINDHHLTEYIDTDNPRTSRISQDDYECFQETSQSPEQNAAEERLKTAYRSFSAEQTQNLCECKCLKKCKGNCHINMNKCGTLFQKEERRFLGFQLFDQLRECWIGLVGHHLLIYNTKHDKQPAEVISIHGYSARPATDIIARDPNKSVFEIFCPGDKTYQFTTTYSKGMEQWIAAISRAGLANSGKYNSNGVREMNPISAVNSIIVEEQYQDVGAKEKSSSAKEMEKNTRNDEEVEIRSKESLIIQGNNNNLDAPPLPSRIPTGMPRRLPSLPHEHEPALSYDVMDDGCEEDDIYDMIKDVKQPTSTYENLKKTEATKNGKQLELETYDDVVEAQKKKKKDKTKKKKASTKRNSHADTYDDIQALENNIAQQENNLEERNSIMYDDIEAVVDNSKKDTKESPRKKSFLGRMRNKKDSSKKEKNKKNSGKEIIIVQSEISQELPTYDDVSELSSTNNSNLTVETMAEYTCPPPPRPIYVKPPTIDNLNPKEEVEELYDDIEALRNDIETKSHCNGVEINTVDSSSANDEQTSVKNSLTITNESSFKPNGVLNDVEHYQVPRPQDPIDSGGQLEVAPVEEELYDDIAILTDFRTRQRDSACSNSSSEKPVTNVVKVWNRFASGRKLKISELTSFDKN